MGSKNVINGEKKSRLKGNTIRIEDDLTPREEVRKWIEKEVGREQENGKGVSES